MNYNNITERSLEPPEDKRRRAYGCAICKEDIFEGDEYYDIPNLGKCCTICIDDAHHFEAEFEGPDPDEAYDSMREEC